VNIAAANTGITSVLSVFLNIPEYCCIFSKHWHHICTCHHLTPCCNTRTDNLAFPFWYLCKSNIVVISKHEMIFASTLPLQQNHCNKQNYCNTNYIAHVVHIPIPKVINFEHF
jgi:hypothetical protein